MGHGKGLNDFSALLKDMHDIHTLLTLRHGFGDTGHL